MAHADPKRDYPAEDPPVREDLILSNQGFVMKIAAEYRHCGLPFEDLLNEGNVGLLEAAQRFDSRRGTRFITYAIFWIRKSILSALSQHTHLVRVPTHRIQQATSITKMGQALSRDLGRTADREEVSRAMSLTVEKMEQILQARMKALPLDTKVGQDRNATILDLMVDDRAVSAEAGMIQVEHERLLRSALRRLTAQQRMIIVRRFGLSGSREHTLAEVGARLGLSRERVRQIESLATKRLRKAIVNGKRRRSPARGAATRSGVAGGA
ncbi:MAG TPA: RNA polymerase sigma factor RpoD/SigA [Dongiaceae bacterium]|nr:RNA polymerase sigma factor RpoD/SigA [Dongiaceae bacterium]